LVAVILNIHAHVESEEPMTPKEVADKLDTYWPISGYHIQQNRRENVEKWVQTAINKATRVRWTATKPTQPGWYWWRESSLSAKKFVQAYEAKGRLWFTSSAASEGRGEWSDKPIQEPE